MKLIRILALIIVAAGLLALPGARAAVIPVTADITTDTTWTANNTYVLQTIIYVRTNITLTIEPGTVVKASTNVLTRRSGIPNFVAGLWVTRGGKLMAEGTAERPIIFTSERDNVTRTDDVPFNISGQWGGIVLCGKARINTANDPTGQLANPKYELFEGTDPSTEVPGAHYFGGNDDNDNSGVLRYVSIRYPGNTFSGAKELNGLTMGGVGAGTDISYVEVFNSSDDAFEWWGGKVNTHHLVAAFCEDDDFDTDQGYRGTNQFWFGIKPTWAGSVDSRAFETDGDVYQTVLGELPKSQWAVHNATLIGRGKTDTRFGVGRAWHSRDEAAPNVFNSVFAEFNQGVLIDPDGSAEFVNGQADARHNVFDVTTGPADANSDLLFDTTTTRSNTVELARLRSISYTNNLALNPRPRPASPANINVGPQGAGLTTTAYRGAFSADDQWAHKWTAIYDLGYLAGTWLPTQTPPDPCFDDNTLTIARGPGDVTISWTSQDGKRYQIQSTDILTGSWANEGTVIPGTGGVITRTFTTTSSTRFYQVACSNP